PSKSRYVLKLYIMKYLKMILPMIAIIFAIGFSFATANTEPEPKMSETESYALMYVNIDGDWHEIEVNCEAGNSDCRAIFLDAPSEGTFQVYNSQDLSDPAKGSTGVKETQTPFPSN
ncbi:DUF6520 family protein, partial [uncultured Salegentibacter sp.]|uniref:DUF6520 family protein n=1 Tax=uncultured Salegentibacter sp. TaxID=259320 RepID=UPI0030D7D712